MQRELIAVAYNSEAESEQASASCRTKQLIVLATDVLLLSIEQGDPEATADQLVEGQILPACFRRDYDGRFIETFHNSLEITRNSLVGDLPFIANTAGELAAHAILARARAILNNRGLDGLAGVVAIGSTLAHQLRAGGQRLADELDALESMVIEDTDVSLLFDVPAGEPPEEQLADRYGDRDWALLRFENWLVPFGNVPRPDVTYDGRVWPA